MIQTTNCRRITNFFAGIMAASFCCSQPAAGILPAFQDDPPSSLDPGEDHLARARELMQSQRWESAVEAYREALKLMPENEEAIHGLHEAETMMNRGSAIQDIEQERQVLLQQARLEFDESLERSVELLAQEDYTQAINVALTAQVKIRRSQNLFRPSEFSDRNEAAERLLSRIDEAREIKRLVDLESARRQAQVDQAAADSAEKLLIRTSIDEKLRRVRQLQSEMKYEEALQVIDEILFLDRLSPAALALRDVLLSSKLFVDYAEMKRKQEFTYAQQSIELQDRLGLPVANLSGPGPRGVNEILQYPEDWKELSYRRFNESGFKESPQDRMVAQRISSTSIPIDFQANSMAQVVNFLEQVTGLSIYVDWKALDTIGISEDDEITLELAEIPVRTALERILEQLGDPDDPAYSPQFAIQDGILTISSDEALRRRVVTFIYDIRDLLFDVPYFDNAPPLDLDSALGQGGGQGGGGQGGGGGGGFGGGGGGGGGGQGGGQGGGGGSIFGGSGDDPEIADREEMIEQIRNIIQDNVDPDGWRDLGGDTGRLTELNGNFIITNTPKNHRSIEGLLAQLREIRALQINMEARVLNVGTEWFEQIGIDLDMYFNTNNDMRNQQLGVDPLGQLGDFFGPDGQLLDPLVFGGIDQVFGGEDDAGGGGGGEEGPQYPNAVPWGGIFGVPNDEGGIDYEIIPVGMPIRATDGFTPIGITQNSLDLIGQLGSSTPMGTTIIAANPAMVTGFQFFDDVQVDLLIQATQADDRSVVLTAPRLTFFNGQRAWVAIQIQEAFVQGLIPITGAGSGAFQPIIGRLSSGVRLDLEAVISADRRYITMTVWFDQSEIIEMRQTAVTGAAGGGVPGGGGGQGGGVAGGFGGTIDLPIMQVSQIRTTVSVPDKGTVMLGGQRQVEEFETEVGVPVLSKVPWLNRFFTNRKTSKLEKTVLVLMRPEIIIQEENEQLLFPGLSDQMGSGAYLR